MTVCPAVAASPSVKKADKAAALHPVLYFACVIRLARGWKDWYAGDR